MLYWNDIFTIEYPCKLHVCPSVIRCLIYIEHLYRLIQYQNVVLILFWYRWIGITGVIFDVVNIGNTANLIEILRSSAIWSMEFPWWNHQMRTVSALWGEPSVTGESPHPHPHPHPPQSQQRGFNCYISLDKRLKKVGLPVIWDDRMVIVTLLLGVIIRVVIVLAFQYFFQKHGSCIWISLLRYAWMQNDITIIWIGNGKAIYIHAENGWCVLLI